MLKTITIAATGVTAVSLTANQEMPEGPEMQKFWWFIPTVISTVASVLFDEGQEGGEALVAAEGIV